jgi:hypothetical protein
MQVTCQKHIYGIELELGYSGNLNPEVTEIRSACCGNPQFIE